MNSFMVAFGLASIALVIGTFLRAKVPFLRNMLVPASVIAGILGMIFMNAMVQFDISIGTDMNMFTTIVNELFTVSFISISLTSSKKTGDNTQKEMMKGIVGMGTVWNLLYALTPLLGYGIIRLCGGAFGMDSIYGTLIPFAFAQGPGQASAFGTVYESFGWENAAMIAVAFAAIGFVVAFGVGIPAAKLGISRGLAKHGGVMNESIIRGYLKKEEQADSMVRDTTCNSNIETLSYHFALIGLCYIVAIGISKIFSLIPGFLGSSMSGLMFVNGMFAAYIVKFLMKKFNVDFLQDDVLQSKITSWTSDYLVVCAFMAVAFNVIGDWIIPMLVECAIMTVVTFAVCFYFGQRFGSDNDFERTLGLYGTSTGTVPSGISLVRIVDPEFKTNTAVELGLMNIVMMLSTPVYLVLLAMAAGSLSAGMTMLSLAGLCVVYLIILKVTKTWGKKSFSWKK